MCSGQITVRLPSTRSAGDFGGNEDRCFPGWPTVREEMAAALASGTPQEVAEGLIRLANEAGGRDNISVVVMRRE